MKSKRPDHYLDFKAHRKIFSRQLNRAKAAYYREKITSNQRDNKELFKVYKTIFGNREQHLFPKHSSNQQLSDDFVNFFNEKSAFNTPAA